MKKILFTALLALSAFTSSQAANLYSSNLGSGIAAIGNPNGYANGTVRFGVFPDTFDFSANAGNYTALNNAFTEVYAYSGALSVSATNGFYQTAHVYDETASFEGTPYATIAGQKVYVWILNNTDPTVATQQAVFSTSSLWVAPDAPVKDTFVTPDPGAPNLTAHLGALANGQNIGAGVAANTTVGAAEVISGVTISRVAAGDILEGGSVTFSVASLTTGSFPLTSYKWRKDGVIIPDATGSTLVINGLLLGDAGQYSVLVSNSISTDVASANLALRVVTATPVILQEPKSAVVAVGSPLTLSVDAIGAGTLTYQWKKGADLPGATAATLSMGNATLAQAGAYTVVVSNAAGKVTSIPAELTVVDTTPAVVVSPVGRSAVLRAVATGKNATYQWFRGNTRIFSTPKFVGATTATLTINSVTTLDASVYTCRVSAPGLSTFVASGATTLRVFTSAPVLASNLNMPLTGRVGSTYTFQIPLTPGSGAATTYTATGLPRGILINAATGLISGRPQVAGSFNVVLGASNSFGPPSLSPTQTLVISAFPANVAGAYVGPIDRSPDLGASLGGRIQLDVSSLGVASGKVFLGAVESAIVGNVEATATGAAATLRVDRKGGLTPLILSFSIANNLLSNGTITDNAISTPLVFEGWRNTWTPTSAATAYVGRYNFSMAPTNAGDLTDVSKPNGTSVLSILTAANGTLTFSGNLADGEKITGTSVLGPNGEAFLFMVGPIGKGSIIGGLRINSLSNSNPADNTITAADCDWNRPANQAASNRLYKSGFDPMPLTIEGGFYAPPVSTLLLGLTTGTNNALITLLNGGLSTPSPVAVSVETGNKLTVATNSQGLSISAVPALGTFSGSFTITPFPKASFQGMIVPFSGVQAGVGYFILNQSSLATSAQRSGSVRFARP
jgi:Immunoglobulin I-set domain/Immunoglobulin domain